MSGADGRPVIARLCRLAMVPVCLAALAGSALAGSAQPERADLAGSCAGCHGAHGRGNSALGAPRLAGLSASYQLAQMQAFASGRRASPAMAAIARALPADETSRLATYYAQLAYLSNVSAPAGTPAGGGASLAPDAALLARGAVLALQGRWRQQLPACTQCHGAEGSGVGTQFPPLLGQPAGYLRSQLQAWQQGTRPPGPMALMPAIAAKLSASDVRAVAAYFSAPAARATHALLPGQGSSAPPGRAPASSTPVPFNPPPDSSIPDDPFGQVVRQGERIFDDPAHYATPYVGNVLRCSSCHLDRGRRAGSAPLWAAYLAYPAYRAKNGHVNTYAERLQGCFRYSMNGRAPPLGSPVLVALETYSYWLARGASVNPHLPGRGYPAVPAPSRPADARRGREVYELHCALCHGADGAGQSAHNGAMAFPPLWGDRSFNWGAGMADVNNAAAFIQANMPLSQDHTLDDQQAWDVALFMDSHERPQDPRFLGSVQATRARFHAGPHSMYGRRVNGHVLGEGAPAPGGVLRASPNPSGSP